MRDLLLTKLGPNDNWVLPYMPYDTDFDVTFDLGTEYKNTIFHIKRLFYYKQRSMVTWLGQVN